MVFNVLHLFSLLLVLFGRLVCDFGFLVLVAMKDVLGSQELVKFELTQVLGHPSNGFFSFCPKKKKKRLNKRSFVGSQIYRSCLN
jgi:hypothetical protein